MKSHNYKRICKLGKGSFGDVQLIENLQTKKLYALKRLDIGNNELPTVLNEVCLLQQLDHPNIIKYHEYFKDGNKFCIVTEYADNGDLFGQITEAKKNKLHLPESTILNWFSQLCLALAYLHKRHVIHRDIKLQNIFLTKEGVIKLGDFGVSKKLENTDDLAKSSLGTPYYISPEICQGRAYNNKSDVWMLGCVLYELCTLERAFNAFSLHTLVKKIVEEGHQKIIQNYSHFLKALIDQMLEKDPEKRPKVLEILDKPEIKIEMRKLLAKHPRIFKNYIENKEEETLHCDNKSISFQDYLKKRNSLADDERVEKLNLQKNSNELCYQENDYNQDSFSNIMTKKHSQNKMATINFKNTTNRKPEATILSRKISLPNEIAHKPGKIDDEKNNQISTEKSTVKNKNNLNIALQAYFPHKPIEKTPSFKNITEKTNDYQLKTPQHNNEKKKALGCPYKRVINLNLNLENSYFQENSQISQNQQTKNNFPYNNSSRINTCEQEEDSANPSKLYSRLRQLKLSNHQAKEEKKNITDIKPVFSISPKYVSQHYTPFSKAQNKENLSYLANRNQQLKSKILQEEAKEKKDDSLHEINISFDEFSKKKSKENKKEEQKLKESTKRSISVHISSKADLDNLVNPVNNFSDFADFLRKKEEEKKKHQESFISFLEKKQIQEYTKKNDSFLQSQKKQDFLKQILLKMLGEKKFSLLLNILSNFEKNGEKQIEKADLSELEEFIGECDKGVILMLQDMYKIANQNDQKLNRMSTSLLLD